MKIKIISIFLLLNSINLFAQTDEKKKSKIIDGIKLRATQITSMARFWTGSNTEIISSSHSKINHLRSGDFLFPVNITFPETLMNSYSFRGAFIEIAQKLKKNDLAPIGEENSINFRQDEQSRNYLVNNFFNEEEKEYVLGKNNWALSADYDLTQTMLGYYWGIFLPLGEKHRFFKAGLGLTVEYVTLQSQLYICDEYEYKISDSSEQSEPGVGSGNCNGKKYIDTGNYDSFSWSPVVHFNLWQRKSKNSVWSILSITTSAGGDYRKDLTFKNRRSNNIYFSSQSGATEYVSYTYRF